MKIGNKEIKFIHDPDVPGFIPLAFLFSQVIAGDVERDIFMIEWDKSSDEARTEFKKLMEKFRELTAELCDDN